MISVVVPCFNERQHIETCVRSILHQDRPEEGLEIIVADGLSEDGTREILKHLISEYPELRVVDNPKRITPCAMNAGIREAKGRYIAILGAHCQYAPNYLTTCVALLDEHPEVSCVGGPAVSMGKGLFGQAVAAAMSNPVGIGNAKHRYPTYEGYAEGACYPVFRREVFEKVGLYDEMLVRNQDDELNYRLAKHGEKVFISPRARYSYFIRETPSRLFLQYFEYGYWRVAVLRKHRIPASLRQIVPPVFMSVMLASVIVGLLLPGWWKLTAGALPILYGGTLLVVGVIQRGIADWRVRSLFPVAAAIMHVAYAAGFVRGLINGADRAVQSGQNNKGDVMNQEPNAATFFNSFAETFDTIYDQKRNPFMRWVDGKFRSDMFIRYALTFEALGQLNGRTVLDVGCGSGPYVAEAFKRGADQITGIDPAPNMLALVRQRLAQAGIAEDRCQLIEGIFPGAHGASIKPHDFAIVMGVMDYVENPQAFLKALRPLVKRLAVVSFPSEHWFRTPFRKLRYRLRQCPVYFYNEPGIRTLGTSAGFSDVRIQKIPGAGMDYHVRLQP